MTIIKFCQIIKKIRVKLISLICIYEITNDPDLQKLRFSNKHWPMDEKLNVYIECVKIYMKRFLYEKREIYWFRNETRQ